MLTGAITAEKHGLHVGLGIPKSIGIEIHNWAEEQDWPEGTELEPIEEYHITMLYSPEGYSHKDAPWIDHESHAVSIKGIKSFPSKEKGESKDAIVLTVDSETIAIHHKELASNAEEAGLEISPFSHDDFKPHITIAYGTLPSGLKPPKLTFETEPTSVSPPRESAWKFATVMYHGTGDPKGIEATGLPAGTSLATDPKLAEEYAEYADQPLEGGEQAVFEVHVSPQHLAPDWPSLSEPVGWAGMTGKDMEDAVAQRLAEKENLDAFDSMDLVGAAKHIHPIPPHHIRRISHWHIKQIRAPHEAELLKLADSWIPKDGSSRKDSHRSIESPVGTVTGSHGLRDPKSQWPNALRERGSEPTDVDCTCKNGHKLDCPVHGMHPTLPTYDDTLEFPDPSSPVGYDYHTDAPRTWMRAETKVAHRALVDPEGKFLSKIATKKKLFLDDTRHPPDKSWDWAKDASEAKRLTKQNDYKHMSLDHDLGIVRYEGKVVINPDALSGGDFALWLHEHRKHMPKSVNIHSHNGKGTDLMKEILEKHTDVTTDRAADDLEEDWAREFKVHEPSEIEKEVVDLPEKVAGLTQPQREKALALAGPDTSKAVYEFPDGWRIHKLVTPTDRQREGQLMHNCWAKPLRWEADKPGEGSNGPYKTLDEYQLDQMGGSFPYHQWMSLRDPTGYPHASFFLSGHPDEQKINNALGHGNATLSSDTLKRLEEYADDRGYQTEWGGRLGQFTASHQLAWLPGSNLPGKGLVTPSGDVHTWPVDKYGIPHHAEYVDQRQPYQLGDGSAHFFQIRPRGGLDTKGYAIPANVIHHILQTVPSLRAGEHTDWHFAMKGHDWDTEANDPTSFRGNPGDSYDDSVGGFGKGMIDNYGRESEWHIGPDWSPEHMAFEKGGVYPDKTWFIWPNGDRNITWDPEQESEEWDFESKVSADQYDTREYQDSRMMPPITQAPNATNSHPEKEGCTCPEGKKLTCPVHGLNPDPTQQEYDHSWSIPQNAPVGYPQDQPRNYMKAEGSVVGDGGNQHDAKTDQQPDGPGAQEKSNDGRKSNEEKRVGIDHVYSVACDCPGCLQQREHSWHLHGEGTSDEGWGGLPRAEGAAHRLQWNPGAYGKGIIDPQGNIHTWPTDKNFIPTHTWYVENELGIAHPHGPAAEQVAYGEPWDSAFGIDPHGNIDLYFHTPDRATAIEAADPRLDATTGDYQWNFQKGGAVEDEDEHTDNLEGENAPVPTPPIEIRKKRKEREDEELVRESPLLYSGAWQILPPMASRQSRLDT